MAVTALLAAAVVTSATAGYMSYEGQRKQASRAEDEAERQALIAREREEREERLERERIEYESGLAAEQAEWETARSLEAAEFTAERIQEEANLVLAAQKAGYAASGLGIEGSPLTVISRTAKEAQTEREQVVRGHEVFAEARALEAEEVKRGGETSFEWFKERLHAETGYEVGSRLAEASMYRTKAQYAEYGQYLSTGVTLLGGAASLYGGGGGGTTGRTSQRGSVSPSMGGTSMYRGSRLTTPLR